MAYFCARFKVLSYDHQKIFQALLDSHYLPTCHFDCLDGVYLQFTKASSNASDLQSKYH